MLMYILGISGFYHDSAACIISEGDVIAAAQEERFTRKKYDSSFPVHAIDYCLEAIHYDLKNLHSVVFYDKPFLKFERILETVISSRLRGLPLFLRAMPPWIKEKLFVKDIIRKTLCKLAHKHNVSHSVHALPILFSSHHLSHAAAAFFPSPFSRAAILTVDGVGEYATATLGVGDGNTISLKKQLTFPESLGLFYSAFTAYLGFRVNDGEYKMMSLAAYGVPQYAEQIRNKLISIYDDGSFRLNPDFFDFHNPEQIINKRFCQFFGRQARMPQEAFRQEDFDIAASVQKVTEDILLGMARHLHAITREKNLVFAGGVALNCLANTKILREGPFPSFWVQPASGDSGGCLGAALAVWHLGLEKPRIVFGSFLQDSMHGSFLGPSYHLDDFREFLRGCSEGFYDFTDEQELVHQVAHFLSEGKIVGWFQGRMEFGPRALGARSILADPRRFSLKERLNATVKEREEFCPFAPAVLQEDAQRYFAGVSDSPYMLFTAQVHADNPDGSGLAAVTHRDHSARVQTVDKERNLLFWKLLSAFKQETGCSVLLNTSFNSRGEPIVCSPDDAYRCFQKTGIDVLVLGNCIVVKKEE